MPIFLAVPVIAGLVGLFAGAQVDHAVQNATTQPTSSLKIPWQVSVIVILIVAVVVFFAVKKFFK